MAFGAFVGAGFEVAAGGVAAFGVNFVAAERAVGPFKENARFYERHGALIDWISVCAGGRCLKVIWLQ